MEIAVYPLGTLSGLGMGGFVNPCASISRIREVKCQLTPTGAIIEGDKHTLLEILHELDSSSFNVGARKRVVVTMKFNETHDQPFTQAEIRPPDVEIGAKGDKK